MGVAALPSPGFALPPAGPGSGIGLIPGFCGSWDHPAETEPKKQTTKIRALYLNIFISVPPSQMGEGAYRCTLPFAVFPSVR
jgi:hypothetical protein